MLDGTTETVVTSEAAEASADKAEGPKVFRIPTSRFEELQGKVARLARRAAKIGVPSPSLTVVGTDREPVYARDEEDEDDFFHGGIGARAPRPPRLIGYREITLVTVAGDPPKFAGWTFLARLERLTGKDGTTANIVHKLVDSAELPESFRTSAPKCDHCKTKRMRKDTFVVSHEDGRVLQVGSNCLADFLGHKSPEALAAQCSYILEVQKWCEEDEGWGGGAAREPDSYDLSTYLAFVSVAIRLGGWYSRGDAYEKGGEATADTAWGLMTKKPRERKPEHAVTEIDTKRASESIAWGKSVEAKNDYMHNLRTLASLGVVSAKSAGLAASLLPAYDRELAREAERKARALRPIKNEYVGTVGERFGASKGKKQSIRDGRLVLECVSCRDFSNEWGVKYLIMFEDAEGRSFKWWATSDRLDVGTTYFVAGTVKKHEEYKGRMSTVLTRCDAETDEGILERDAALEKAREEAAAKKAAWKALKKEMIETGEWVEIKASELRTGMQLAESPHKKEEALSDDDTAGPIHTISRTHPDTVDLFGGKDQITVRFARNYASASGYYNYGTFQFEKTMKPSAKVLVRVVGCAEVV